MHRTLKFLWLLVVALAGCGGNDAPPPAVGTGAARVAADTAAARPSPPSRRGEPREITFDDIKFDMEKGAPFTPDLLPKRVTALEATRIRIRGYILPSFQQTGLTQFLLVRDQGDCCFGGNPKITDRVLVNLKDPKGISFTSRQRKIAGRFVVRPTGTAVLDGGVLYHLEDASMR